MGVSTLTPKMEDLMKIVILGAGGVGKSAITIQLVRKVFQPKYDPTIEDSYRTNFNYEGENYQLEILDTAGQDEFKGMRDMYYKSGDGFLLVYDIGAPSSLDDVRERYGEILSSLGLTPESA